MKKTNSMRVAVVMLALTLITSCFVGGTFAKYITRAESKAGDLARVAKWGVEISSVAGDLFAKQYEYATDDNGGNVPTNSANIKDVSVKSSTEDKVVAPGTKNEDVALCSITGTPEVAVRVDIKMEAPEGEDSIVDIVLPKNGEDESYKDFTGYSENFSFTDADYHPVKFTLKQNGTAVAGADGVELAAIKTALDSISQTYDPNTNLSNVIGDLTLSWEWAFQADDDASDAEKKLVDQKDTYLGQLAAAQVKSDKGETLTAAETELLANVPDGVKTAFNFVLSVTVTQID